MSKKILSYSLWGNTPMYTFGAIRNAELSLIHFPDWICRFYISNDVDKEIVDKLKSFNHTEVVIVPEKPDSWQGSMWRFFAIDNKEDIDYIVFRDTDSRLTEREASAVNEWIDSERTIHIMRDHPCHTEAIMAGMWGCRPKELLSELIEKLDIQELNFSCMEEIINAWLKIEQQKTIENHPECLHHTVYHTKGIDQQFLRRVLYKLFWNTAFIHDSFPSYNCFSGRFDHQQFTTKELNTGFPHQRGEDWNDFIGQVYDENDVPNEEYANLLKQRDECIYMNYPKEDAE